jgi:hypothetical protein
MACEQAPHNPAVKFRTDPTTEQSDEMRFRDTLGLLLLAPLGAMGVYAVFSAISGESASNALVMFWVVGAASLVAGMVFVLPVLVLVPKLRQPPAWIAALWGATVAVCVGWLTDPVNTGFPELSRLVALFAASGAASGLTYAFASKRNRARAADAQT